MKLDSNSLFFNWSQNPWHVFRQPLFPDWNAPGNAFSASVVNVVTRPENPLERPQWMGAQFCATVTGGQAEFVMYASDAGEYGSGLYPWMMKSWVPLVQWVADPVISGITHYWKDVPISAIDALMAMSQPAGIRFGAACRFLSSATQIAWHSARMLTRY